MVAGSRWTMALLIGGTIACLVPASAHALAAAPATPKKAETPVRPIAITINGEELARDPAPRFVGYRLMVPVVRIYNALGIAVSRDGDAIVAAAPSKTITLHIGSSRATVDNRVVMMDGPAVEIAGATFVPLRFVGESLGAQVNFNQDAARVDIISSLVGRTPSLTRSSLGGSDQVIGTVSAVDLNSAPESITVTRSGSVRTVSINSDAKIVVQDVITKTNANGTLNDIHVGDAVSVYFAKDGRVDQLVDRFASRAGTVAAVSPSAVVLQNGFVVTPDRSTEVTLNGVQAAVGDLKVGDSVVIRSNPDTGEKRQIIVSRVVVPTAQPSSDSSAAGAVPVVITSFAVAAKAAMKSGDAFDVTLKGTPGGRAAFDIGTYISAIPMREDTPGTYTAHYTVPPGINFGQTALLGHLSLNGTDARRAQSAMYIAVSNTPPSITDVAPPSGQTVNNSKPSIYATYGSPTDIGINASAVTINVNGLDVTASATRTATFITYSPSVAFPDGVVNIKVTVFDNAGNKQDRNWSFTVRTR
jgi:hypothetical protein